MTEVLVPAAEPLPAPEQGRRFASSPVVLALLSVVVGFVAGALYLYPQPPAEGSADVGFARDMSRHHVQAVAMAETLRSRTADPTLRVLATDIALTQQAQIGMMSGWLMSWGRLQSSDAPQMTWMGAPTTELMPGMASPEQVQALSRLPLQQAEEQFLRLMVAHHSGGVAMAKAGLELAQEPPIVALAEGIATSQAAEVEYLQSLLAARGAPAAALPGTVLTHAVTEHHGGGPTGRDALLLTLCTLGLLGFLWLFIDAVARRAGLATTRRSASAGVLVLASMVTAAVHLALTPAHGQENPAFGVFFFLSALTAVLGVALLLAGAARSGAAVLGSVNALLVFAYVLFRLVPPPGQATPEHIDVWGIVAVAAELTALVVATVVLRRHTRAGPRPTTVAVAS